jgi:hypothetical protein
MKRLQDEAKAEGIHADRQSLATLAALEKSAWAAKKADRIQPIDLDNLARVYGLPFALWALRCAEPVADANLAGRLIAVDMALAAFDAHPEHLVTMERENVSRLARVFDAGVDLEGWRPWVRRACERAKFYLDRDTLDDLIGWSLSHIQVQALYGGEIIEPEDDWSNSGLSAAPLALSTLTHLLCLADPRYAGAVRIADLAKAAEARWQRGTRLDFEFCGEIQDVVDRHEMLFHPEHKERALDLAWRSWNLHLNGAVVTAKRPKPLIPRTDAA